MHSVRVNRKAAGRLASGHPWIFSSDVTVRGEAEPGDAVVVVDPSGRALGTAHYSASSQITLRMLSDRVEPVEHEFFLRRIAVADAYRKRVVSGSDAFRLIFAEADQLPGLIVDRYGGYLVIQTLTQGMDRAKPEIVSCLEELFAPQGILERNDASVRRRENLPLISGVLRGEVPARVEVRMNDLAFGADLLHGQKTGIYLDQRENYVAAARYAQGRALDCFTSTGGFALHMASRCENVLAVDSSAASLQIAETNRTRNGIGNVQFEEADVFEALAREAGAHHRYSTVVLDPPAFARSRASVEGATRGYKEINRRALELLAQGGILVTCSCSHHVSEAMLLEIVAEAALDAGRKLRVIERRTLATDHPILLTVPETLYLKCLILEVLGT